MNEESWAPVIKGVITGIVSLVVGIIILLVIIWAIPYFTDISGGESSQLSAPTLETVGTNGITTDTTPLLDWGYVSGADYYEIQVDDYSSFYNPTIATTSNYLYYACTTLPPGTYYWRVRAVDYYGNPSIWAIGFFIIESTEPSTTISENGDNYNIHHEWSYGGSRWIYTSEIPKTSYDYFSNKPRVSYYSEYVDNPADDVWMENLAHLFVEEAENEGWGEFETVSFVLAFVQSWPYTSDNVTTPYDEYPRYPIETLVDNGGDCEDTSILFASIVRGMGYGTVLLNLEEDNHIAVGVLISENVVSNWNQYYPLTYYTSSGGNIYAYCEATGEGWELGHKPEELTSTSASLIFI